MKQEKKEDNENMNYVKPISSSVTKERLNKYDKKFRKSSFKTMARNTVTTIGPDQCIDSERLSDITHIFLNTVKKKDVKATNQQHSGRCWMFAGLNMFRHSLINALDLDNFEFSETYLFFYDKLERCNTFLTYFMDKDSSVISMYTDRFTEHMLLNHMNDGGWFSSFINLVKKYGVVPKSAMPETYSSGYTDTLNTVLHDILYSAAVNMTKIKSRKRREEYKEKLMNQIYDSMVIFLGHPPKNFTWYYTNSEGESFAHSDITPQKFTELIFQDTNLDDFVVLSHIPVKECKYGELYEVEGTKNVVEGQNCTVLNLPINELKKYAKKSLISKIPVWMSGDVGKGFDYDHMALDDKLVDKSQIFGKNLPVSKGERINMFDLTASHAMCFTGFNENEQKNTLTWQIENSWGYYDNETPGIDGFLCATDEWFTNNVLQVAVHKRMLSNKHKQCLNKKAHLITPWNNMAPALYSR